MLPLTASKGITTIKIQLGHFVTITLIMTWILNLCNMNDIRWDIGVKVNNNLRAASLAGDGHQLPWAGVRGHGQGPCTELPGDPESGIIERKVQVPSKLVGLPDRPKRSNHIATGHVEDGGQDPSPQPAPPVELIHHFTLAKRPLQEPALGREVCGHWRSLRVLVVEREDSRERHTRGRPVVARDVAQGVRGRGTPRGGG